MSNEKVRLDNLPNPNNVSTRLKRGYVPVSLGTGDVYIDPNVGLEIGVHQLMRFQGEYCTNGREPFYMDGQLVTLEKGRKRGRSLIPYPIAGSHTKTQIQRSLEQALRVYRGRNRIG